MHKRDNAIKDITSPEILEEIIKLCPVCHVAMFDETYPYLLGFNFGYSNKSIYLHCTKEGKKIDLLRKNNHVCVYFDTDHEIFARNTPVACSWRMKYRSVQAFGKAFFVDDYNEKLAALHIFMANYTSQTFSYSTPAVNNIQIIRIDIEQWQGRSFEYN